MKRSYHPPTKLLSVGLMLSTPAGKTGSDGVLEPPLGATSVGLWLGACPARFKW
jgi:hypothetical protein